MTAPASALKTHRGSPKTAHDGKSAGRAQNAYSRQPVPRGAAKPLAPVMAGEMGQRFGEDFSNVRLHEGADAQASAEKVEARAYTLGEHIVLGRAAAPPDTADGKRLLAHELAHVVQQRRGGPPPALSVDAPHERSADQAAHAVVSGSGPVSVGGATGVGVARDAESDAKKKQKAGKGAGKPKKLPGVDAKTDAAVEKGIVEESAPQPPPKSPTTKKVKNTTEGKDARKSFNNKREQHAQALSVGKGGQVHHGIELQALKRYPGAFTAAELNAAENMRGIRPELEGKRQLHNSKIREVWDRHYNELDAQLKSKGLKKGTPAFRAHARKYLLAARAEMDYLYGKLYSEAHAAEAKKGKSGAKGGSGKASSKAAPKAGAKAAAGKSDAPKPTAGKNAAVPSTASKAKSSKAAAPKAKPAAKSANTKGAAPKAAAPKPAASKASAGSKSGGAKTAAKKGAAPSSKGATKKGVGPKGVPTSKAATPKAGATQKGASSKPTKQKAPPPKSTTPKTKGSATKPSAPKSPPPKITAPDAAPAKPAVSKGATPKAPPKATAPEPMVPKPSAPKSAAAKPGIPKPSVAKPGAKPGVPAPKGGGGPSVAGGAFSIALPMVMGWLHGKAVEKRIDKQSDEKGFVPQNAPSGEGLAYDLGAWLLDPMRDAEKNVDNEKRFKISPWRQKVRNVANSTPAGGTFDFTWEDPYCSQDLFGNPEAKYEYRKVTYKKGADGRLSVESGDASGVLDLNDVISDEISDAEIDGRIPRISCGGGGEA